MNLRKLRIGTRLAIGFGQATALARSVAQFRLSDEPQGAPDMVAQTAKAAAAGLNARAVAHERKVAAAVPAPRAPAIAAPDEDWKEF